MLLSESTGRFVVYMSPIALEIIWRITELFFVLSLLFLVLLFVLKKVLDSKKSYIQKKQMQYMYHDINVLVDIVEDTELIAYSQVVGMRLLSTTEHQKREKIKQHIMTLGLFDRLLALYRDTGMYRTKLYIFSSLVLLADTKGRTLFLSVINNPHKRKEMPEFITLALFGLSLSTVTKEHLVELYEILERIDQEEYPSQKFAEFFFIQAYLSMQEEEILDFLSAFEPEKFSYVCYALLYALQPLPPNPEIFRILKRLHQKYQSDPLLLVAVLRVQYQWKLKDEGLILSYHQHSNDLVRILCAKIGLSLIPKEQYGVLSHYMCDQNAYVRKNYLIALSESNIPWEKLVLWVSTYYPLCLHDRLFEKSLLLYKKGVS